MRRVIFSILIILSFPLLTVIIGCGSRSRQELNVKALEGKWFGRWKWLSYSDTIDINISEAATNTLKCEIFARDIGLPDDKITYEFNAESAMRLIGTMDNAMGVITLTPDKKITINLGGYPAAGDFKAALVYSGETINGTFYKSPFNEPGTVTMNRK